MMGMAARGLHTADMVRALADDGNVWIGLRCKDLLLVIEVLGPSSERGDRFAKPGSTRS